MSVTKYNRPGCCPTCDHPWDDHIHVEHATGFIEHSCQGKTLLGRRCACRMKAPHGPHVLPKAA